MDAHDFDVCVIGFGPTGATLANLLGQAGLSVLVLERESAVYHLPRAVHFDDEVMRVFQTVGLANQILPTVHVSPGMRFVDQTGRSLLEWPRPPERGPMAWHASYRFHQPELEQILRDGLTRFPTVQVRTRSEVLAVDDGPDTATVRYEDLGTATLHRVKVRYVVACDGARSFVRRKIGDTREDLGFDEPWLVVDVLLRRPMPELGDFSVQFCDPDRAATYVRGTGVRRRWEIALKPGEDPARMTEPANVWGLLSRWITPGDAVLERAAAYVFQSIIARPWRSGRLLIAGDAAHQTPPFLGQGMCAGIRDAANLAWKLDRVLRGIDDPSLLDTYESERAPHVREYIALAVRLGGLINTRAMEAALPAGERRGEPARMESIKPALGPGLAAGWDGLPRLVAPQPRLSNGVLLDDHTGYRMALLTRPGVSLTAARQDRLTAREVVTVTDPATTAWLDSQNVQAAAIRPDRYVLGAARDEADLAALIATI